MPNQILFLKKRLTEGLLCNAPGLERGGLILERIRRYICKTKTKRRYLEALVFDSKVGQHPIAEPKGDILVEVLLLFEIGRIFRDRFERLIDLWLAFLEAINVVFFLLLIQFLSLLRFFLIFDLSIVHWVLRFQVFP